MELAGVLVATVQLKRHAQGAVEPVTFISCRRATMHFLYCKNCPSDPIIRRSNKYPTQKRQVLRPPAQFSPVPVGSNHNVVWYVPQVSTMATAQ